MTAPTVGDLVRRTMKNKVLLKSKSKIEMRSTKEWEDRTTLVAVAVDDVCVVVGVEHEPVHYLEVQLLVPDGRRCFWFGPQSIWDACWEKLG